jgi:hypothetical protein
MILVLYKCPFILVFLTWGMNHLWSKNENSSRLYGSIRGSTCTNQNHGFIFSYLFLHSCALFWYQNNSSFFSKLYSSVSMQGFSVSFWLRENLINLMIYCFFWWEQKGLVPCCLFYSMGSSFARQEKLWLVSPA